jgi:hypothetical protein
MNSPYWSPDEAKATREAIEAGMWVSPIACGIEACGNFTSIVVLCPATTSIALTYNRQGKYDSEEVDAWMQDAAEQFLSPLCCAVDAHTAPLALQHHMPAGNCYWVRYQGLRDGHPWHRRRNPPTQIDAPYDTHPNQIKALALARQLYADFHDFETVHTDLHLLQEAAKRLACILHRNFVPDLQYVVANCHDKVRF